MKLVYNEKEAASLMHVHWYNAQTLIPQRKREKEEKKETSAEKDKSRSFAYPAAFLILLVSLFISRYVN